MPILPLRSYRATLVPPGTDTDELETRADQGALPTIQIKAINRLTAEQAAYQLTGKPVLRVERIEAVAA